MKDVYHCTPSEFDLQDDKVIQMHREFIRIENEEADLERRRAEQRARLKT